MDDPVPQQFEYDPIDPILTIGVTAKKIGVAPETLRLYEREGKKIWCGSPVFDARSM